jgi:hypothetical protein
VAQNALDLVDGNPVNLRHLGNRHAVLYPSPDARSLRRWNLNRRRRWLGRRVRLIVPRGRPRRNDLQHTRFARRWVGGSDLLDGWGADRRFRGKQGFGGLARSGDPLAIIAATMGLLVLSTKQGCSEWLISFVIIEGRYDHFGKPDLGSQGALCKLAPCLNLAHCNKQMSDKMDSGKFDHFQSARGQVFNQKSLHGPLYDVAAFLGSVFEMRKNFGV